MFFQSFSPIRKTREIGLLSEQKRLYNADGTMLLQHGVARTNCVDCLDRTNVAQFGIGKFFVSVY